MRSIAVLAEKSKELTSYRCHNAEQYLDDESFTAIGNISKSLKKLRMGDVSAISPDVFKTVSNSHTLEELEFTDLRFSATKFDAIAESCPNLKSLTLNIALDSDVHLKESNWRELKVLRLSAQNDNPSYLTSNLPSQILTYNCKLLRSLTLKGIQMDLSDITNICSKCIYLTDLTIGNCEAVNDDALLMLSTLQNLKTLCLERLPITPAGIIKLIQDKPGLLELKFDLWLGLKPSEFKLVTVYPCSEIRRISVFREIPYLFLLTIASMCPKLLCLNHSIEFSPEQMLSVIKASKCLETLALRPRVQHDHSYFSHIAATCPALRKLLCYASVDTMNLKGFDSMIKKCPHLVYVEFQGYGFNILGRRADSLKPFLEIIKRYRKQCFVLDSVGRVCLHFLEKHYIGQIFTSDYR